MSTLLMTAVGIGAEVELLEDRIRIRRNGFLSIITHGVKGDKDILVSQISAIQLKRVGRIYNGYIQFSFLGGLESKKGILDAYIDENTVSFNSKQQESFLSLKERIDGMLSSAKASAGSHSNLDNLKKLAELKDSGIVTEEEFAQKKRQLLGL